MPKKTVRITIPTGYVNDLADLVKHVWDHHVSLGASSPFAGSSIIDMAKYEALMTEALEKRARALALHAEAESLMMDSRVAFGISAGQTIQTPDTLYQMLNNIKRFLLVKHSPGREEALTPWGFNVVVGSSSVGAKKKKKV